MQCEGVGGGTDGLWNGECEFNTSIFHFSQNKYKIYLKFL